MNRCFKSRARIALIAGVALVGLWFSLSPDAFAQGIRREAPKDVVLGRLLITAPPEVILDGKVDRLSPGSRIRDLNNMVVLSGGLVGKTLPIVYRRDSAGLVHEAWILTDEEYTKLGGAYGRGDPNGVLRFIELLNLIFGMRR